MDSCQFRHADVAFGGAGRDDLGEDAQRVVVEVEKVAAELRERGELRRRGRFGAVVIVVRGLGDVFGIPYVPDIGYPTPGSLGTWCCERKKECVTLELPRMPLELLFERFGRGFAEFLAGRDV